MIVKMNEIQDTSLASGSLMDVPEEISPAISNPVSYTGNAVHMTFVAISFLVKFYNFTNMLIAYLLNVMSATLAKSIRRPEHMFCSSQELRYVGVIPQGLKTDMGIIFQVSLPADANEYAFMFLLNTILEKYSQVTGIIKTNKQNKYWKIIYHKHSICFDSAATVKSIHHESEVSEIVFIVSASEENSCYLYLSFRT